MILGSTQLTVDIKTQDRLRQWFAQRENGGTVDLTHVALGDSDFNYEMSQQYEQVKILSTPYNIPDIKHKLLHTGGAAGVVGDIECYLRRVNSSDEVESLYNYPPSSSFVSGSLPPTQTNQYNFTNIPFDTGLGAVKEGFIVFMQTLPSNYVDNNNVPLRLKEQYTISVSSPTLTPNTLPTGWELIEDITNGSFLIAKPATYTVWIGQTATIKIKGNVSAITTTITFPY